MDSKTPGWLQALDYRFGLPAYAELGWLARKRLDVLVICCALRRRVFWRMAFVLAGMLLLLHALRWRYGLDTPLAGLLHGLSGLVLLPAAAVGRRRLLRVLCRARRRRAAALAASGAGCCNSPHAPAREDSAGPARPCPDGQPGRGAGRHLPRRS